MGLSQSSPQSSLINAPFRWIYAVFAVILIAVSCLWPSTSSAQSENPRRAHLSFADSTTTSVTVTFEAGAHSIEVLDLAGETYHHITMSGAADREIPGAPVVPTLGTMLGVASTTAIRLKIVDTEVEQLAGYQLLPGPISTVVTGDGLENIADLSVSAAYSPEPSIYNQDALYPGQLVEVTNTGMVRDQAVVYLQFHPVQYNPARGEVHIYKKIVAQISWEPVVTNAEEQAGSPVFERVLREVLPNYAVLDRPAAVWPGTLIESEAASTQVALDSGNQPIKIEVNTDGIFRLMPTDLSGLGMDLSAVDPRTFMLKNRGQEIPLLVLGEEDGRFDPEDAILFYGSAIDDLYTASNVYWLSNGAENGKRFQARNGTPQLGNTVPEHFPVTEHVEENTDYWRSMPNGKDEDHWFWGERISPSSDDLDSSRLHTIMLQPSADGQTARVRVRLKGFTALAHRTRIFLNGSQIDEQTWEGQIAFEHDIEVDHSLLQSGDNEIVVEATDAGASIDQVYINWLEIEYQRTYVAASNTLVFGAPDVGTFEFQVTNLDSENIAVFDISDPSNPLLIVNPVIEQVDSKYRVSFRATAADSAQYLALTASQFQSPAGMIVEEPSHWKSTQQGADYIIITYGEFYSNTLPLADYHQSTGLRVAVTKVEDLYDEFNDGIFNPSAIRDFLVYAYENWQPPAPTYVLLVGDAFQDYRDRLGTHTRNYVPSQLYETKDFGEVVSDNWFVTIAGDDTFPDMLIGRLSADQPDQVDSMVRKSIDYAQNPPDSDWNNHVLFVADDDSITFEIVSDRLLDTIPQHYEKNRVYASEYPASAPAADIGKHLDAGSIFVNYVGHGDVFRWGKWNNETEFIWGRDNVADLQQTERLSVVTVGNCLNGFFSGPTANVSLAEVLQRTAGKGAVAVFAPTGSGTTASHQTLLSEFYETIFKEDQIELGTVATVAKLNTAGLSELHADLLDTYILFGDPATEVGIGLNPPYVESTSPGPGVAGVELAEPIQVTFSKPVDADSVVLTELRGAALALTPTWSNDSTVVTYEHEEFALATTYEFSVTAKDRTGLSLIPGTTSIPWTFTTVQESIPPTVTLRFEQQTGDTGVGIVIRMEFSEPMNQESIRYGFSPFVSGSLQWDTAGQTAIFVPDEQFLGDTTYTVTMTEARDLAGNRLPATVSATYTVGEPSSDGVYLPAILGNLRMTPAG